MTEVLIVDDDKLTRKGLISVMPWTQYDMHVAGEASNGSEALSFLRGNHVDLVLSDLEMPGMQGLEFIEKASSAFPDLYFVVLTIYTDFALIQQALRLGAIDYIAKTDFDRENYARILDRIVCRMHREESRMTKAAVRAAAQAVPDDKLLEDWADLSWLWQTGTRKKLLDRLMGCELSESFLTRLTERITAAWNEEFLPLTGERLPAPSCSPPFNLSVWSDQLCQTAHRILTRYPYSEEIFISILRVGSRLRTHLADPVRIQEVAESVHLSRSYFCQCFRDLYRMSFLDYLRLLRMEKAEHLLRETNASIQSIARDAGYEDEKYFSRIFKTVHRVSPLGYRRISRK